MMELVDFNENMLASKEAPKAKTTRRSRGTKEKAPVVKQEKPVAKAEAAPEAENVSEEPAAENTENKE
jgi:hypothetical protein